jgi:NAD(P)-dependent dehydrogenase (short-subunit alcohol dehydrogenase family)
MANLSIATAVITGAGSGIGAALAAEAVQRGASTLFLLDIDAGKARKVQSELAREGLTIEAIECDVSDAAAVERIADHVFRHSAGPFLICANAGVDASNTADGTVVLLPTDPDASARRIQHALSAAAGGRVVFAGGVMVMAGGSWRRAPARVSRRRARRSSRRRVRGARRRGACPCRRSRPR